MASQPIPSITAEEYLDWERKEERKHEYLDGQIVAMAGASFVHALLIGNLLRAFARELSATECREFGSDLRLSVGPGLICYPDLLIACPPYQFLPGTTDTLVNPKLLVEVLSPSTRGTDRSFKLPRYRNVKSLAGYLFIEQDRISVEYGRRVSGDEWKAEVFTSLSDRIDLEPLPCTIDVSQIYADVQPPT